MEAFTPTMTNERRNLLLKVFSGNTNVLQYLYLINDMVRADDILRLLIRQGCVGNYFEEWIHNHCFIQNGLEIRKRFSTQKFYELLVAAVEKNKEARTLFLVKDILPHGR